MIKPDLGRSDLGRPELDRPDLGGFGDPVDRRRVMGMSATQLGLVVGLVLGVVAAFGGFGAFLIVVVLAAIGLVVGRVLDGRLDLTAVFGRPGRR